MVVPIAVISVVRGGTSVTLVNDSRIAACCLVRELPLATSNVKDVADFRDHEGLELVS